MIKDVEIRVATPSDVRVFYPAGSPRSAYAWIVFYKGKPACLAGVTLERGGAVAFCDIKTGIEAPKMTIWRVSKEIYSRMKHLNLPMITAADPCQAGACEFLKRLGFIPAGWQQGMEILSCR